MAKFKLVIDPGASLTKILLGVNEARCYLVMQPQIIRLPRASIEAKIGVGIGMELRREDVSWVQLPDDGDECYAIGKLAEQLLGGSRLKQLKYESAVYKCLAAIGAMAQIYDIPNRSKIDVVITLPYGEYRNHPQLVEQLETAAKSFIFRGQKYRFYLNLQCKPEGAGLFFWQATEKGVDWIRENRFDIVMVGH